MRRILCALIGVCVAAALAIAAVPTPSGSPAPGGEAAAPRRVKVLWFGDDGHHQPLERCRQVFTEMAERGIDLTYTDDPADLNPQTLGRYDCLLLYANIDKITPEQERALVDYVASGRGFVPVHCGSYCFLNSPRVTALTGGRFKRHGTGVFKETIVQADHPIERGLKPIESWDESYVHEMHNEQGRTVLGVREDAQGKEPYTWVRTEGKGRVFYTAWGHDQRTWGNKDFQDLLERGVRWAAGDWAMQPQPRPPLPMVRQEHPIPNYLPGQKWGTEGGQIFDMQKPLPPAESVRQMVLPPGFEAKLVAAEPDIFKPVTMTFDERGRMWVSETVDYPNELQPTGKGRDQIKVCEDTDGDGKADKFTVFADKLSIPTSLCVANGGLIVAQAPDMLFLKDTDGDGRADERRVLFTGWGTDDTHAGPSNLRWGFDNWVYGVVGYSGFRGTVGGQTMSFRQGIFRMKPDGSRMEFLGNTNNNTWGLGLSEDGHVFASTANSNPSFYLSIPNRYYEQVRGSAVRQMDMIADSPNIFPVTSQVRQMDHHGEYTAGAGFALYTARSYPREYWNRIAFLAEPTAHLVGQFVLEPKGAGFTARNDFNLLGSFDGWTGPIMAEVGPDGSVWVIDWYNYIIQHNPIPKGFEKGKGNAYVTPLRDKTHGRVYRLVYGGAVGGGKPSPVLDLSKAGPEQLVAALKSDNQLWRMHAQRLLVERGDRSVVPALAQLAADPAVDAIGLNAAAVHALWTIHGLGGFGGGPDNGPNGSAGSSDGGSDGGNGEAVAAAERALRHPSAGVRKAALEVLPRTGKSAEVILAGKVLEDRDPHVRKSALLALSEMPPSDAAGAAVYAVVAATRDGKGGAGKDAAATAAADRALSDAATIAAARNDAGFLKAVFAAHAAKGDPAATGTPPTAAAQRVNLIPNPSFEEAGPGGSPKGWKPRTYAGTAGQDVGGPGRTGDKCVVLRSEQGADTSWFAEVPVTPNTDYTLSGWVKADKVEKVGGGMGALFNVHGMEEARTPAVTGTSDWKRVEVTFNSGALRTVSINCLFGGWGRAKGTAWFDDVELTRLAPTGLAGAEVRVIEAVVNQYAQRAPADSVVATLSALKKTEPGLTSAVMAGLSRGWPKGKAPQLSDADVAELRSLMGALPPDARDRLLGLADKWGRADLFGEQLTAAKRELAAAVGDGNLDAGKRAAAARRLIAMDDTTPTLEAILKQINPASPPEVQAGLLEALSDSRNPDVGRALVKQWGTLTPTGQRAALELTLRRVPWTQALLAGIKAGTVNGKDLQPQHWQTLTTYPDEQIVAQAKALEKSAGRAPTADRKGVVDKMLPLADKTGDPAKGKLVFERNCQVCHTLEGQGGKVGPLLTGMGARPRADNLIDILDPNRSVEGTYRQWTVKTVDDVLNGRLSAESKTSIEIIDAAGQTHAIQRDQIKALTASDRSVMPEGFEALPPEDLVDLLEYMGTSKEKAK